MNNLRHTHMRRFTTSAILVVCTVLFQGCDDSLSIYKYVNLRKAEARWATRTFQNYTFETRASCFCPPPMGEWCRVTVHGSIVTRVTIMEGGVEVDSASFAHYPTVESLFTIIENARGADIDVEFDSQLGYPTLIRIHPDPHATDSGFERVTRNLVPMP